MEPGAIRSEFWASSQHGSGHIDACDWLRERMHQVERQLESAAADPELARRG
jgi:hypothetical protein